MEDYEFTIVFFSFLGGLDMGSILSLTPTKRSIEMKAFRRYDIDLECVSRVQKFKSLQANFPLFFS